MCVCVCVCVCMYILLTEIGLTPGGSSTVHIYTQTILRTTQLIWEEGGPCPVFASYTLDICLTTEEKARKKPQSGLPKRAICHDENRIYRTEHT